MCVYIYIYIYINLYMHRGSPWISRGIWRVQGQPPPALLNTYIYIYIYVHTSLSLYMYIHIYAYVYLSLSMYIYRSVYAKQLYLSLSIYLYIYIYLAWLAVLHHGSRVSVAETVASLCHSDCLFLVCFCLCSVSACIYRRNVM